MKNFDNEIAAQGRALGAPIIRNRVVNTDMVPVPVHPTSDAPNRMFKKTLAAPGQFGHVKRVLANKQLGVQNNGGMPSNIDAGMLVNITPDNQKWEQGKIDSWCYLSQPDPTPKTLDELRKWFCREFHVIQGERKAWFEEFVTYDDYGRKLAAPVLWRKTYTILALSTRTQVYEDAAAAESAAKAREAKLCTAMYTELANILDKATGPMPLVRMRRDFTLEHNTMHEFAPVGYVNRSTVRGSQSLAAYDDFELPDGWALDFETDRYRPIVATWAVSKISVRLHMDNANVALSSACLEDCGKIKQI